MAAILGQVLRTVVAQSATLAAAGIVGGLLLAAALAPLVATQLYGVRTLDPPTMAAVPALLLPVAILACIGPARRAMTIDPVNALRSQIPPKGGNYRVQRERGRLKAES